MQLLTNPASETAFGLFIFAVLLLTVIGIIVVVSGKCFDWVINKQ